jgi:hypothetical protein
VRAGAFLFADQLLTTIKTKHQHMGYKEVRRTGGLRPLLPWASPDSSKAGLSRRVPWTPFLKVPINPHTLLPLLSLLLQMVLYIEACESGSMFEGLLPKGLGAYAVTASNAEESSWGTYCPGERLPCPPLLPSPLPASIHRGKTSLPMRIHDAPIPSNRTARTTPPSPNRAPFPLHGCPCRPRRP